MADSLTNVEYGLLENAQARVQGLAFIIEVTELGSKAIFSQCADSNSPGNLFGYTPGDERLAWFRRARLD